jgi:cyclopropane-fatty-acyl-phospholipid synthase
MTRPDAPTQRSPAPPPVAPRRAGTLLGRPLEVDRFPPRARRLVALLDRASGGRLALTFPDGQQALFGSGDLVADIALRNWDPIDAAFDRGDIGFAESFIAGNWQSTDPALLLRFVLRHRTSVDRLIFGSPIGRLVYRLRHLARRNSRRGAARNIRSHDELGNEFYAIWLDPSMTYSSALFESAAEAVATGPEGGSKSGSTATAAVAPLMAATAATLYAAQQAKYRRVLAQLRLAPASRVLEIGCGWGGFAELAARAGHRVTGLTLSPAQVAYARTRLERQALPHELALRDYRDEHGLYDGVASIEMFEAVGEKYWPRYFETMARCLRRGARACVQTITIAEHLFERYRTGTDFIQQYLLPGGMLPSVSAFERAAAEAGLRIVERLSFGRSYARTLCTWRTTFDDRAASVRALGFDERFLRTWSFYLAYCEAAFAEGNTDVFQFTLGHR